MTAKAGSGPTRATAIRASATVASNAMPDGSGTSWRTAMIASAASTAKSPGSVQSDGGAR